MHLRGHRAPFSGARCIRCPLAGEGLFLAARGIVLGIGGALPFNRVLASLLFEIKPADPETFAGVAVAIATIALAASPSPPAASSR